MIYLIGLGKHAKTIGSYLELNGEKYLNASIIYRNSNFKIIEKKLKKIKNKILLHIAIGDNLLRERAFNFFKKRGYKFKSILHTTAICAKNVIVKENVFIGAGAIINNHVKINQNCIINTGSIVEHDVIIESNVHLAPGSKVMGSSKIGKNSFIGAGAIINNNLIIVKNCVVASGAVVINNLRSSALYAGVPANKKN